jgi:hypothetical protein
VKFNLLLRPRSKEPVAGPSWHTGLTGTFRGRWWEAKDVRRVATSKEEEGKDNDKGVKEEEGEEKYEANQTHAYQNNRLSRIATASNFTSSIYSSLKLVLL